MSAFGIIGQALAAGLSGAGEGLVQGTQEEIKQADERTKEAARVNEIQVMQDAEMAKQKAIMQYQNELTNAPALRAGQYLKATAQPQQDIPVPASSDQSTPNPAPAQPSSGDTINRLVNAIRGVESGGNPDAVSSQGANGSMQIMPATFKQYAQPGEDYNNDADRTAAAIRKIKDDYAFYNGDVAKTAAAYIGGRGAIKDGVIRSDVADNNGTTPADYASRILGSLSSSGGDAPTTPPPTPAKKPQAQVDQLDAAYKAALAAGDMQAADFLKKSMIDKYVQVGPGGVLNTKTNEIISPDDSKERMADKKLQAEILKARMASDPLNLTGWRQELTGGKSGGGAASTDLSGLSGQPLLDALPKALSEQVKGYAEGRLSFPTGAAMRNPRMGQILDLVAQYDPQFDAVNFGARSATRKDFTSGKSATAINAINTTMQHLGELMDAGKALDNSSYKAWNYVGNAVNDATGDPRITRFNTARNAVIDEVEKAYRGSGGSQAGIDAWKENVSSSSSPEQIKAAGQELIKLLDGKIEALGDQYSKGMGVAKNGLELLSPKARSTYNALMGTSAPSTGVITSASGDPVSDSGGGWSNLRVH